MYKYMYVYIYIYIFIHTTQYIHAGTIYIYVYILLYTYLYINIYIYIEWLWFFLDASGEHYDGCQLGITDCPSHSEDEPARGWHLRAGARNFDVPWVPKVCWGWHWIFGEPREPIKMMVFQHVASWFCWLVLIPAFINYRFPFQKDLFTRTLFQGRPFSSCSKRWQERSTCPGESSNPSFCHELIRDKSVQLSAHVHIWAKTQVMWWTLRSFWFQSDQRTAAWWKSDGLKGCVWCFGMFWWISWVKASAAKRLPNAALSSIVAIETKKN